MKDLYLIRHGQSQANANHVNAGRFDSPLSDLGRTQVVFASQTIRQFYKINLIVSSPLSRALQTAWIIADSLGIDRQDIVILPELTERNLGLREGQPIQGRERTVINVEDIEGVPGTERLQDFYNRARQALHLLEARPEQAILIVAHNGIGRMLRVVKSGGQAEDFYQQPRLGNALLYKLS